MNDLVSVVVVTRNRQKDLIECISSLLKSDYKPLEIVVIDNASTEPISTWFKKKFPKVNLITSKENLGAAGGRNLGIKHAKGKLLLFMDDDAKADKKMVSEMALFLIKNPKAGVIQPKIFDKDHPKILQGAGHSINLLTGRISAWGVREKDIGQYNKVREVPLVGCIWMVRKSIINKVGDYDEDYFIPYEDSDFCFRVRKAGFKNYCIPTAVAWHQGYKKTFVHPLVEWIGITSAERAYRVARNKLIFIRKHSPLVNKLFFYIVMLPFYAIVHSILILFSRRSDILLNYWKGLFSGLKYSLFYEKK